MHWAKLLARVFGSDALTCHCGGTRKVIAALTPQTSPEALTNYLSQIGESPEIPTFAPARAPPQLDLFEGDRPPPDESYFMD